MVFTGLLYLTESCQYLYLKNINFFNVCKGCRVCFVQRLLHKPGYSASCSQIQNKFSCSSSTVAVDSPHAREGFPGCKKLTSALAEGC